MFKILKNMYWKLYMIYFTWRIKQATKRYENTYEFIYGIKSYDDLSPGNEANLYTMNDLDIIYNKKTNKYTIGIETIYSFSNGRKGEQEYIKDLLNKFTEWMQSKGYDTNTYIPIHSAFTHKNINSEFDSIEELYAYFKMLVNGFVSQEVE